MIDELAGAVVALNRAGNDSAGRQRDDDSARAQARCRAVAPSDCRSASSLAGALGERAAWLAPNEDADRQQDRDGAKTLRSPDGLASELTF